jgi:hypothetical protein
MDFDKRRLTASQTDIHAASRDVRLSSIINTIHVFVADFIDTLVRSAKSEQVPGLGTVRVMKDVLVRKLILAIHNGRIDLQWRLLQILRSISKHIAKHIHSMEGGAQSALVGSAITGLASKTPHTPHPPSIDTIVKTRSQPELRKINIEHASSTAAPLNTKNPLSVVVGQDATGD